MKNRNIKSPLIKRVTHVWSGHGEGALYVNGKKVSDYYTRGESSIVQALGFTPECRRLDENWSKKQIRLPEKLAKCVFAKNN